jgi:hypothetical protein
MKTTRRLVMTQLFAFVLCWTWGGAALANDRSYNESAYREYRAAKRQQVSDLCDIWWATWRPGTVGKTYVVLAGQYDQIDLNRCSPALRKHVKKAERTYTEIGELFGQSTMPDIEAVIVTIKGSGGFKSSSSVTSERGRRVLELMRELSASEEAVIKELGLDE